MWIYYQQYHLHTVRMHMCDITTKTKSNMKETIFLFLIFKWADNTVLNTKYYYWQGLEAYI